jgi:hypothetical protein
MTVQEQKFFASFFQKRSVLLLLMLPFCAQAQPADEAPPPAKIEEAPAPPPAEEVPAPPPADQAPAPPADVPAPKQEMSPPDSWQPRTQATLRVMNKIDSTVQTLSVPVGGSVKYESLSIRVSGCYVRPPDLPADAAAHLTITDARPGQPGFDAWMLKNEPALNMLEHPVYDVQLAGCA